ncbi:AAA family ATPase [Spelaeicoccus albus]|uniref:MoxR-like ATPase n=1 Tax=Spelaeicoccus albus TaxID=1280376 RepID=A0A7Z0D502_9MICO|nr:MoxR family ATPase [Spelaeicoccus albus]NYI69000.1 MoxR-like ATPase [Spelaeicoccus albus]
MTLARDAAPRARTAARDGKAARADAEARDGAEGVAELAGRAMTAMSEVLDGKPEAIELAWTVLLAEGHLLVEDVPGVGKTLLAKCLSAVVGGVSRRIQFTPDLLPSDVIGVNVFDTQSKTFRFRRGPIFANIVIGDEINRASPKTQSALLESMAERQASVDGETYELSPPFMVVATQNPVDMEGTYPLPEAQRDRFMARISIGYPAPSDEITMLTTHARTDPLAGLEPTCSADDVLAAVEAVRHVRASDELKDYIVRLLAETRDPGKFTLGASPRSGLHLLKASMARAAMQGRGYVLPDDVKALATSVLTHRLIAKPALTFGGETPASLLEDIVSTLPVH